LAQNVVYLNIRLRERLTLKPKNMSKINELKSAVGKVFSDNHSSTNSSMLVSVSRCGNVCYTMEMPSQYKSGNKNPKAGIKKQPSWLVWNGLFY
jgi:hypothetical protein